MYMLLPPMFGPVMIVKLCSGVANCNKLHSLNTRANTLVIKMSKFTYNIVWYRQDLTVVIQKRVHAIPYIHVTVEFRTNVRAHRTGL